MLADKVRNVVGTGADRCTAGDASCLMNIGGGLSRRTPVCAPSIWPQILASTRGAWPR